MKLEHDVESHLKFDAIILIFSKSFREVQSVPETTIFSFSGVFPSICDDPLKPQTFHS
jgi:hypothetical protein